MRFIGLPEILVLLGILFLLGFALILLVGALRSKQSRSVQRALIERIPANELADLLQRPDGEKLVRMLSEPGASPGRAILTSVQRGIVAIVSGVGIFVAARFAQAPTFVPAIAIMLVFLGIGLLAAALVSYRLSKRWRLLEENGDESSSRRAD